MRHILITGALGFIGRNLIEKLLDTVQHITIFDKLVYNNLNELPEAANLSLVVFDINDKTRLHDEIDTAIDLRGEIDLLIHLAAQGSVVESINDPIGNFSYNVCGTVNILEAARIHAIQKVIVASTGGAIAGNTVGVVDEMTLPNPLSPYGASKGCAELYCQAYARSYDIQIIALRFSNIIGPKCNHKKGVVNQFLKRIQSQQDLVIYGDRLMSRDFLDVDDLCEGIKLASLKEGCCYSVYHLSSGIETTIESLAKEFLHASGMQHLCIRHLSGRKGEVYRNVASNSKARLELGFEPKLTISESVSRIWKWASDINLYS